MGVYFASDVLAGAAITRDYFKTGVK